uniref:Uncharacterized protein n=1 Tax=Lepeophtheirus salmonis TaxID=72036 RepID=A0A0K2UTA8_LEPSM
MSFSKTSTPPPQGSPHTPVIDRRVLYDFRYVRPPQFLFIPSILCRFCILYRKYFSKWIILRSMQTFHA